MTLVAGIDATPGASFGVGQGYAEHIMTNFFLPFLADARNNSTVLYNMVEKLAKETTSGRFIVWPTRTTRNTGRGAIGPGGQLSDPSSQGFASCFTETRTYQGRIKIAGELLRRGKTNGGAFFPIEPMEVEGQMDDIAVDFNRMIHNDGSGRLAEAVTTAVDATTTLTIRINQSIEGAANCPSAPTMYLEIGDRIGFAIPGTDALRANAGGQNGWYVVAIPSSTTIQVATVAGGSAVNSNTILGLVAGDWIVRVSSEINTTAASSGRRREMMGIEGIFSDTGVLDGNAPVGLGTASVFNQQTGNNDYTTTTLASAGFQGNLATTAFPWNRAVVLDNGGGGTRAISEVLLQQAFSDAEERNNAQIDLLLSSYATYNSYVALLTPDKRFNDTLELRGGHKVLSFNGVGWVKDRFAYGGRVKGINMGELSIFETEPLSVNNPLGLSAWERLNNTDDFWMGHIGSQNLAVKGIRQRVGFNLVDLSL
jgi:hypothetical protein